MAIGDAYANAEVYRRIASKDSRVEDIEINADLLAVTRHLTSALDQFFTQDDAPVARLYRGDGSARLYLTDHEHVPGIATLTGLIVKVDVNGDYDVTDSGETLTIGTHFWAQPPDADKGPEARPWRYLDLVPGNAIIGAWPARERAVEVTARYGWPAIPEVIETATCHLTAILRLETPRGVSARSEVGEILGASREAQGIISDLIRQYRGVPTF